VNNNENDFGVDIDIGAMGEIDFEAEFSIRNEGDDYK
jgi:tetrahydromethanopterin S-methyltransferase subunit E